MRQSDQAAQRSGLAGAVAAEERDDFALANFQSDAMQNVALAVEGVQAFCLKRDATHAAAFPR
jgi:hypothetical protein